MLPWFTLVGSGIVFVLLSLIQLHKTIAQDELWWLVAAQTYLSVGKPLHYMSYEQIQAFSPYLYLFNLVTAMHWFGIQESAARLPGILSGVVSIILIFLSIILLSPKWSRNRLRWATFMSFLYALSPITVQGALIIDIDNTILIPSLLFLCLAFLKYIQKKETLWAILLSVAVMITLWTKLTTSLVVIAMFSTFILLCKENSKYQLSALSSLLIGVVAFILSWYAYCGLYGIPFNQPFDYLFASFIKKSSILTKVHFVQHITHFTLWASVFFIGLVVLLLRRAIFSLQNKQVFQPEYGYLAVSVVIIVGYSIVGGATFGFPKYQCPAIALVYIAAALIVLNDRLAEDFSFKKGLFIALLAFLFQYFINGDLIYIVRYILRQAAVSSPEIYRKEFVLLLIKFGFLVIASACCMAYLYYFRKYSLLIVTLFLMLGANSALAFLQAQAPYQTGYNYGAVGTRQTTDFILKKVPRDSTIIAPQEIIYYVKPASLNYKPDSFWASASSIVDVLISPNTSCFVYSIVGNTVNQVQLITSDRTIINLLRERYSHVTIGSYEIWIAKSLNRSPMM